MAATVWYPTDEEVLTIHDDILSEYPQRESGVQDSGDIEFACSTSTTRRSERHRRRFMRRRSSSYGS